MTGRFCNDPEIWKCGARTAKQNNKQEWLTVWNGPVVTWGEGGHGHKGASVTVATAGPGRVEERGHRGAKRNLGRPNPRTPLKFRRGPRICHWNWKVISRLPLTVILAYLLFVLGSCAGDGDGPVHLQNSKLQEEETFSLLTQKKNLPAPPSISYKLLNKFLNLIKSSSAWIRHNNTMPGSGFIVLCRHSLVILSSVLNPTIPGRGRHDNPIRKIKKNLIDY